MCRKKNNHYFYNWINLSCPVNKNTEWRLPTKEDQIFLKKHLTETKYRNNNKIDESMNKELMFSSENNEWETPPEIFNSLNNEFHFTLDPCCSVSTAKCSKYYTIKENGLIQDWKNEIVFVNPPYGKKIKLWVKKCYDESLKGTKIVMLIPSRTDTSYFHNYIYGKAEIRFLKGRIKFLQDKQILNSAPFPSMIVIYN